MKKQLRKYGSSLVIVFNKEDKLFYDLNEGEFIDVEICKMDTKNEGLGNG